MVVRLGRGRHRRADDHVIIGHERQHLDAVLIDGDEAAPRLGQRKVDLSCLPEEFGEFFGGIRCADRLQILFEPTSAISAQDDRLPQQFHCPAEAAWCVALDDRGRVVGRRRDTAVASSRAFDRNTGPPPEQVSPATFMTSLMTTGSPCALPSGSPRATRPSASSAAVRQDSGRRVPQAH